MYTEVHRPRLWAKMWGRGGQAGLEEKRRGMSASSPISENKSTQKTHARLARMHTNIADASRKALRAFGVFKMCTALVIDFLS